MTKAPGAPQEVYTLLAHVGRKKGDGLPPAASGGALLCYAAAADEAEAARETAAILRDAGLSVLEVEGHGALAEREAAGHEIGPEDRALMARAQAENAVIVAEMTPVFED
ncbi:hypothetical protein [Pikeienuella sp. HZG-20]|uniref:hypothetical protein n=1 Tax=Paludibacillus litoralis TaxID=3133267 RepID=UPI0030EC5CAC